ncbi:sugar ABC transporter ATP-binding protein [Calidifontibacter sp. DB0510]|uniref:Sugar ABC transporter ATP-binding protein n=1 Tax=Metallococcus carri TaxID=1656884 RepID=A0A967E8I9_9MICO|nr:sugar ABC transporter ATP-binding protein [Metallococcus carri]NHN54240.1 sugar ABC transporter ATP-binding protein [Metallococcus carri]NOP36920.1 sugar ABC transporter ATP-binding protein [Calidifontibacter sp. DB2511S]
MAVPDPAPGRTPLIEITALRKVFGGTVALDDVDLRLEAGTIHALLGQNGAGKSTLIKILAGVYTATSGVVVVGGTEVAGPVEPGTMAFIHQDLGLVEWMSVAENIALGTGYARRAGLIDWSGVHDKGAAALQLCAAHLDPRTPISSLSRADRSLVAIARALAQDARIIVLDEPTASLPAHDSERLFAVLKKLRDSGHGILYISHRLDEVFRISDHVTVLRDGAVVADGALSDYTPDQLVEHIVGKKHATYSVVERGQGPLVLELSDVVVEGAGPVSLRLHAGEVLGMTGLTGAGHMQLGRALAGSSQILAGSVELNGKPYAPTSVTDAVARGTGFVTSNRVEEGCAPELTNRENLLVNPAVRKRAPLSWMSPRAERREAHHWMTRFGVRPLSTELPIATLSGGNQQKIMIGRWLSVPRTLLILEEPTAGVDVGAKADIYALLDQALADGLAVLLISTDFEEVVTACRTALVFVDGQVTTSLSGDELTIPRLTTAASSAATSSSVKEAV